MNFTTQNALKYLKIGVALSILTALFMSYQIPQSFYKTLKLIFLIISLLGMFLVMNYKTEKPKRVWNIVLSLFLLVLAILTFLEKS
jgi:cell division protein FtsW (lipid II flippase)